MWQTIKEKVLDYLGTFPILSMILRYKSIEQIKKDNLDFNQETDYFKGCGQITVLDKSFKVVGNVPNLIVIEDFNKKSH